MTDDMMRGYLDGIKADAVRPGPNRSQSYVHGWLNGRDDRIAEPRASAAELRERAAKAQAADAAKE